jgi:hypothetical protein
MITLAATLAMAGPAAAMTVTTTNDANTLANAILGSGVTLVSATYVGAAGAAGTFTGATADGLGFNSGILLTSGSAALAPGPNNADGAGVDNSLAGYAPLTGLLPSGSTTFDATRLEITFQFGDGSTGGDLFFNYVFASEEYNEFANTSFNDVFAFFLDGTAPANNRARLPSTTTDSDVVSINNVNGGNPFGTNAKNPIFYRNNDPSDGGPFFNIQYDGLTTVLSVTALGLASGQHTMILAISDTGDGILDSGVFIQGGTFSSAPTPTGVPLPATAMLIGIGLLGGFAWRRRAA